MDATTTAATPPPDDRDELIAGFLLALCDIGADRPGRVARRLATWQRHILAILVLAAGFVGSLRGC